MTISTKFYVTKAENQQVFLSPVCRGIENREWASSTPGGSLQLYITNPAAFEQFEQHDEWVFIGHKVDKPKPHDGHPVDHYEDHPAYDPSKTLHICKTCGGYASLNEDGTPNWSAHETLYDAVVDGSDNA